MNIKEMFQKTEDILKKYQFIWEKEPIDYFPNLTEQLIKQITQLKNNSLDELINIENLVMETSLNKEIKSVLIAFPIPNEEKTFKPIEVQGLSAKKVHEISRLIPYLKEKKFSRLIDIGSGKAHLSFLLAKEKDINCLCYDADEKIQNNAIKERQLDRAKDKIKFINAFINEKTDIDIKSDDILFGLHACGDLSIHLMNQAIKKHSQFLNIPCCFHKMTIQNLSGQQNFILQKYALNLANRSKVFMTQDLYEIRYEFKQYRYALEFIYQKQRGEKLPAIGNAHKSWYKLSFSEYVKKYDQNLFGLVDIEDEFNNIKETVHSYILMEVIRNPFARLLEQYILLDRALYLEKSGFNIEMKEIFDSKRSPRNISLYASKKP